MKLIIVRHGKAEADSPTGRDQDRRLKHRGERQVAYLADHFARAPLRPALIISSSFERAIKTAQAIQKSTGVKLHLDPRLQSGRPTSDALAIIEDHTSADPLMLVGHNPQLGELIDLLTRGAPPEEADLRTGEAVVIEIDPKDPVGQGDEVQRIRLDGDD